MKNLFTDFLSLNSSKWAPLLMTFTLSANAQVVDCGSPIKWNEKTLYPRQSPNYQESTCTETSNVRVHRYCRVLAEVDISACEISSSYYQCKLPDIDPFPGWNSTTLLSVNRGTGTAVMTYKSNMPSNGAINERKIYYENCKKLEIKPKL